VISSQVTGCLSFWVADEMSSNSVWGQVGYYICNGPTPVAFYQIWKSGSVAVTGTTSLSTGSHQFSMYLQSGTTWAYLLDGGVFGTYNMGSSTSSTTYPIEALSEEGYVSAPWNPLQVQFTQVQVMSTGVWSPVPTGYEPYGCSQTNLYSCWGAQGNLQNPSIPDDALVVGGSTPVILSGTTLWNDVTSTSTSTISTTSSTSSATTTSSPASSSSMSTSSTSSQGGGTLQATLTITPSTNKAKSTEYFTVQVTDQYGNPVGGASVSLTVMKPNGKSTTITASTNSAGQAYLQYKLSAASPLGTYNVSAIASAPGYVPSSATGTFTVT